MGGMITRRELDRIARGAAMPWGADMGGHAWGVIYSGRELDAIARGAAMVWAVI